MVISMAVQISAVEPGSYAQKHHIRQGEWLLSINGHEITDVLDYRFYLMEKVLNLAVKDAAGALRRVMIRKRSEYDDIGLEFATYLMDKQQSCRNKCIFCFIDQLPRGMRESLYFKDDDSRLSFLFGNYITLTNIQESDIDRIIEMHISPINISVHTTNPELRVKMMRNRFAGDTLRYLKRLSDHRIKFNCQLVLCPGVNDGDELRRTLTDLIGYYPSIENVAIVPVGLTKYRDGLEPLTCYTKETALEVLHIVDEFGERCVRDFGCRIAYCSDEFYLKAGRPLPQAAFYGAFNQLENGVGLISSLREEFMDALAQQPAFTAQGRTTLATGVAAASFMQDLIDELGKKCHNLQCEVVPIVNDFFGHHINVAGLVTGQDIIKQLQGKELGDTLLFPSVMLRSEGDLFLDDISVEGLEQALQVRAVPVDNDGYQLLDALLGRR